MFLRLQYRPSWRIDLRNDRGITISDVLMAVYTKLHRDFTRSEYNELENSYQPIVSEAFYARAREDPHAKADGLKRIDFYGHCFMFSGLVPEPDGHWLVCLTPPSA